MKAKIIDTILLTLQEVLPDGLTTNELNQELGVPIDDILRVLHLESSRGNSRVIKSWHRKHACFRWRFRDTDMFRRKS